MTDDQSRPNPFREGAPDFEEESDAQPIVTLLTDFGSDEHYVGVMKGVVMAVNPVARIVDISHSVKPYDVKAASLILDSSAHYFPRGTIHVAVVDPGVGSSRRGVMAATENYYFVGPDNGLFSCVYDDPLYMWTRELEEDAFFLNEVSSTFHGRDIFAPVAGHLSCGVPPEDFGSVITDPIRFDFPLVEFEDADTITGEVIYVDHYGNLVTNIDTTTFWRFEYGEDDAAHLPVIEIGGHAINGVSEYYQAVKAGELGAQFNSWTRLEIFVPEGNAAQFLEAGVGEKVKVHMRHMRL